jgi:endonuclease YncB( thermonuclease family)
VPIASAETLTGRVVGVTDGDTITLLGENRRQHRIRLAGIDAPEKGQPFGQKSKQALSDLVFRQDVMI